MPGQSDRTVACAAIQRYDVAPLRVRLAARSFNSTYRVTTASAVYALRVGSVLRIHPDGTEAVEAAWSRRLRERGVHVPAVLANASGEVTTLVSPGGTTPRTSAPILPSSDSLTDAGGPRLEYSTPRCAPDGSAIVSGAPPDHETARACVLFDWVAGRLLRKCVTERRSAALGALSARLHQAAVGWSPAGAGDVLIADRVLYWRVPERLAEAGTRFGYGTLFTDAMARAQSVLDALWRDPPHPPRLVHGDLTPANVIVAPRAGLVPIDFQDTVLGFEVQDLSMTVAALRRLADGSRLEAAFRAGYTERRPWPDGSPDLFESLIAARGLHQMNITMNVADDDRLVGYVAGHAERTRAWMR